MTAPGFVTSWYPILQVSSSIVVTPMILPGSGHQFANPMITVVPTVSVSANAIYTDAVATTVTPTITAGTGITFPGETTSVTITPAVSVGAQVLNGFGSAVTVTPSVTVDADTLLGATPSISVAPTVSAAASIAGSITQSAITATPSISASAAAAPAPTVTVTPSMTVGAGVVYSVTSSITATPSVAAPAGNLYTASSSISATPSIATAVTASTIAFDALGAGVLGGSAWSHNAQTGAYVLALLTVNGAPTSVKYGSTTMTNLGHATDGNGNRLYCYGLASVATGPTTITVSGSVGGSAIGNSISFTGANSAATPTTSTYTGTTSGSQSPTCTSSQVIVQAFEDAGGDAITSASGGTLQWSYADSGGVMTISTATTSTTFDAGLSAIDEWASLAVVLSP